MATPKAAAVMPTLKIRGKLWPPVADPDPEFVADLEKWVPIDYILKWFKDRDQLRGIANRFLAVKGETASGKSTTFPAELYQAMIVGKGKNLICTQPRVLTTMENVKEMQLHYPLKMGENIGFSTKSNKVPLIKGGGILSATVGTLAQMLRSMTDQEFMDRVRVVMIDEAHERDIPTDITISMLKQLLVRCQHLEACPFVVVMSATFDQQQFLDYFGVEARTNFIWCRGETAGFDTHWPRQAVKDYVAAAVETAARIARENPDDPATMADILIFLPGAAEISQAAEGLARVNQGLLADKMRPMSVLKIDSVAVQTQNLDYRRLGAVPVEAHEVPARRCILSTNVAETGLTLSYLKYVIDSGYNREVEYQPQYRVHALITKPAPKSRITQRRGRAGRKFRGVFFPLYPESVFAELPAQQLPQILLEDISAVVLDIIAEQAAPFDVKKIDMIDAPSPDAIWDSLERLYVLGFYDPAEAKLTPLGELARRISGRLEISRLVLGARMWGVSVLDLATIAAWLKVSPKIHADRDLPIDWVSIYAVAFPGIKERLRWLILDDFIDGLILFIALKKHVGKTPPHARAIKSWCEKVNISYPAALNLVRTRDEFIEQLVSAGIDLGAGPALADQALPDFTDQIARIKHAIYDAYRLNLLELRDTKYYTQQGLEVRIPELIREDPEKLADQVALVRPRFMLFNELGLKFVRQKNHYEVVVDRISVMDGFVSPDIQ